MASSLISLNLKSSIENRAPCGNACGVSSPLAQKGFREGHSRRLWGRRTLALEMEVQQEEERSEEEERGWKKPCGKWKGECSERTGITKCGGGDQNPKYFSQSC